MRLSFLLIAILTNVGIVRLGFAESPAKLLGWHANPSTSHSLCLGMFREPWLDVDSDGKVLQQGKVKIVSNGKVTLSRDGTSVLHQAVVSEPGRRISADRAYLYRNKKTKKIDHIRLSGQVIIRQPGKLLRGDKALVYLDKKSGYIKKAWYYIAAMAVGKRASTTDGKASHALPGVVAWGRAENITQKTPTLQHLKHATYSVCSPTNNAWHLSTSDLTLNKVTGRGTAYNAVLYAGKLPVFYTPFASFPIDNRRQTGLLYPLFGHSDRGGYEFSQPFYLNLAPNYDATITPHYYSKRGILWDGVGRYMTKYSQGKLEAEIIYNDRALDTFKNAQKALFPLSNTGLQQLLGQSRTRKALVFSQNTKWNKNWSAQLNYKYASDDYYFQDFGGGFLSSDQNQLKREAKLDYQNEHWQVSSLIQSFQTLHPINEIPTVDQYSREPQISIHGDYPGLFHGLDLTFDSQFVRLKHSVQGAAFPNADRENLQAGLSWPMSNLAGYVTPSLQVQSTRYQLHRGQEFWPRQHTQRTTPISSLDTGLFFQRPISLFGTNYRQTLEPRLFYLYVPYRHQDAIPIFDSLRQSFTYDQLFRSNRFSGFDRIGDANQLAYGVTSRLLDDQYGREKMSLSVGQLIYFRDRLVTLCHTDACRATEDPFFNQPVSPIASQLIYNLTPGLSVTGDFAWNVESSKTENLGVTASYHPSDHYTLYSSFNYRTNVNLIGDPQTVMPSVQQFILGGAWKFASNWTVLGGFTNQVSRELPSNVQNFLYGLQYDSCCWAFRLSGGRSYRGIVGSSLQYDHHIYAQLLLKGLGSLGQNQSNNFISGFLPNYQNEFMKQQKS